MKIQKVWVAKCIVCLDPVDRCGGAPAGVGPSLCRGCGYILVPSQSCHYACVCNFDSRTRVKGEEKLDFHRAKCVA